MPYDPKKPIKILTGGPVQAPQPSTPPKQPGVLSQAGSAYGNYVKGLGKGLLSTVTSLSGLGEKVGRAATPKGVENFLFGKKQDKTVAERLIPESARTPVGAEQKLGFMTEQIAETILPLSKVAKAEKAIDTVFKGSRLLRVGAKAATEAAVGGAVTLAQTGDINEAKKSAAIFGGTKLGTGVIGEALRGTKIPEWMYQRIFKNNYKDAVEQLRAQGAASLRQRNPQQYQKLLEAGILTESGGKTAVNESLAKEALERGLKGSIDTMANEVVQDGLELEYQARNIAKGVRRVQVTNANKLADVLMETAQRYENVGSGEVAKQAGRYATLLRTGTLTGEQGLKLRRFLDGMRLRSSFDSAVNSLSQNQENFRYWSDSVRGVLAKVPGMAKVMDQYRFSIEALESIAKEAARRGNNQLIGLIDSMFIGATAIGSPAAAATLGIGRRALNDPRVLTNTAQAISKSGSLSSPGAAIKSIASYLAGER